ncbi:hypothetical protein ACFSC6_19145 [Rufibacter sediminis]|uniref:hypothetical protein n=1 Tax=Rufibacter sediminis TaxID=2762756 RepID=UPI00210E560B|nr:hypothetical protein [Rufibacter sediminis]
MVRTKTIFIWVGIFLLDVAVYAAFSFMMMSYDDFYEESKGEYLSWSSMSSFDRAVVIGLYIWHAVNIFLLYYIVKKFARRLKQQTTPRLQ